MSDIYVKDLQKTTVLFLCTGNYYRSRFAEILFNSVTGKMGLSWKATSRGLALERGVNNVGPMAVSADAKSLLCSRRWHLPQKNRAIEVPGCQRATVR
jgi:low molecular weight protein-tyrosine phosphatase